MTTAVKEKKPFLPQRKPRPDSAGGAVALRTPAGPRGVATAGMLAIGGDPRVHLLPLEVTERKKIRQLKRRLLGVGAFVVVIVAAGYGLATFALTSAQGQLSATQATTTQLLSERAKYGEVTKVNADEAAIQQSQKTATAQQILWAPYLASIEATLPPNATITAVGAVIDTPFGGAGSTNASATLPLQGPRIATIGLTVSMPQADVPTWLTTLPTLKGFVDATPDSVTSTDAGNYTVVVTLHVNSKAVTGFAKAEGTNK
jgi:Tfp pilus assembly protein PilN